LNAANRSFFALVAVALAPYVLIGMAGCGVLSVVSYRVIAGHSPLAQDWLSWIALGFVAASTVGSLLAVRTVYRQVRATRQLHHLVRAHRVPTGESLSQLAEARHLRVEVVDASEPYSFSYGTLTPRVVVSRGLLESVEPGELDAVLVHERYHVRNLDPLKVLIARTLPVAFFFLPVLRELQRRYVAGRELAADRSAIRACGRRSVAGALYKVVAGPPSATLSAAAAIGGPELLEVRIAQLETECEPPQPRLSPTVVALSAATSVLMVLGLVSTSAWISQSGALNDGRLAPFAGAAGSLLCALPWVVGIAAFRRRRRHRL
jgi:beta-lactamase regulating signal transducer with metallopeptidase domain